MHPVVAAVLKAGIVSPTMLAEMKRFSPSIDKEATAAEEPMDLETAARLVEEALESEQYVVVRETDLEVVKQFSSTTRSGTLYIETDEGQSGETEVAYGKTPLGEYIIAWHSDSIESTMTNGKTHLLEDGNKVFFKDVRELFFGETKAFMVCKPSSVEPNADPS